MRLQFLVSLFNSCLFFAAFSVGIATADKNLISLSVVLPFDGNIWCTGHSLQPVIEMAKNIVNQNQLLPGYNLTVDYYNGQCTVAGGLHAFIETVKQETDDKLIVGIVGPACSTASRAIGAVSQYYPLVSVSYSSEASDLTSPKKYPYFLRTAPPSKNYYLAWIALVKHFGWRRFAVVVQNNYGSFSSETLQQAIGDGVLDWSEVTLIDSFGSDKWDTDAVLSELQERDVRIIFALLFEREARSLFCAAKQQNMTGCCSGTSYVWVLPDWFDAEWWKGDSCSLAKFSDRCRPETIQDSVDGYLMIKDQFYTRKPNSSKIVDGLLTVKEWKEMYHKALKKHESELNVSVRLEDYTTFAFDAMFTWAFGLRQYLEEGGNPEFISTRNGNNSLHLKKIMSNLQFDGISGFINFTENDRESNYLSVNNYVKAKNTFRQIGVYNIKNKSVESFNVSVHWGSCCGSAVPPDRAHGDSKEDDCAGLTALAAELGGCDKAVAVVSSAGFFGVLVVLIVFFIIYSKKYAATKQRMRDLGLLDGDLRRSSALLAIDEFEIPRMKLQLNRKLGEGCFGAVYGGEGVGVVPGEVQTAVAVKTLRPEADATDKVLFLEEVRVMKELNHKNIVHLIGVCTKDEPICAVMELMVYGDLKSFLLAHRRCLHSEDLHGMALDVGKGLQYLHSRLYVHRDIASRNCLVTLNRLTKLGDFGLTRKVGDGTDYYRYQKMGFLPVRWMAPESLLNGIFTFASDVWSFGVLLYEIITMAGFPYQGFSNHEVVENVPKGLTIDLPRQCPTEFCALVKQCWQSDSTSRPNMTDVVTSMERTGQSLLFTPCTEAKPEIISASGNAADSNRDTKTSNTPISLIPAERPQNKSTSRPLMRRFSEQGIGRITPDKRRLSSWSLDAVTQNPPYSLAVLSEAITLSDTTSIRQGSKRQQETVQVCVESSV